MFKPWIETNAVIVKNSRWKKKKIARAQNPWSWCTLSSNGQNVKPLSITYTNFDNLGAVLAEKSVRYKQTGRQERIKLSTRHSRVNRQLDGFEQLVYLSDPIPLWSRDCGDHTSVRLLMMCRHIRHFLPRTVVVKSASSDHRTRPASHLMSSIIYDTLSLPNNAVSNG